MSRYVIYVLIAAAASLGLSALFFIAWLRKKLAPRQKSGDVGKLF